MLLTESGLHKIKLLLSWAPLEQKTALIQGTAAGNPCWKRHSSGSGEGIWHSLSWQSFPIYFWGKKYISFKLLIILSWSFENLDTVLVRCQNATVESQNIAGWKGPTRILESNSCLHIGPPKTRPCV